MKNLKQNVTNQQVVKASITTHSTQGFCNKNLNYESEKNFCKNAVKLVITFLLLIMLCSIEVANAQGPPAVIIPPIQGGKIVLNPGPLTNFGMGNVNLTGEKICDFWLKFDGQNAKVKSLTVNGKVIKPVGKVENKEHAIIDCIADKGAINISVEFTVAVTNLVFIPTDSMHSDLLCNETVNPNAADPQQRLNRTTAPGGTQSPVFASSSFPSLGFTNLTGTDICDLRIESTALIDCVFVNNSRVDSTYAKGKKVADGKSANANAVHVYFPCINKGDNYKVTVKLKGEVTTYKITPTDSIHADVLINDLAQPGGAIQNGKPAKPTNTTGGRQSPTFSPSSFPRLSFVNETGTDICDMHIDLPTGAKVENVWVNDKPVDSIRVGTTKKTPPVNAQSVHIYFPCIAVDAKYTVSVKINGVVTTYNFLPTDSLNADIVTGIQDIRPGEKVERKISFPGTTSGSTVGSNRPSVVFVNHTKEDICDLEITAPQNVTKIKVNGIDWPANPPAAPAKKAHYYAPAGNCIPPGGKFVVTVYVEGNKKIESFTVTLTDTAHDQILLANFTGGMNTFLMPNENSTFGLSGRSGSLVAINESCSPISQLVFTSPNPGIIVDDASSNLLSYFDYPTHTLYYIDPVLPGSTIDFRFTINSLLPYSPTDTFPYTTININVPGVNTPFDGYGIITPSSSATAANGSIDFNMNKGVAPFNFVWSNGTTNEDLNNILPGTYTLTVTSPSGCMQKLFEVPFDLPVLPEPQYFELVPINVWCNGAGNGAAIAMQSGNEAFTYLWSNGANTGVINNLFPGTYTCTVMNLSSFVWSGTVTITEPTPVALTGVVTNLNCNGDLSGAINITPSGGTPYYQYLWNNGKTIQNRTSLKAATYTVTVKDGFGCTVTSSFKVKQPAVLNLTVTGTDVQCGGGNNGSAFANATGGTAPYNFQWSNGMTGSSINGLTAGIYNVMLNDAHGCNSTGTVNINQPPPIMINVFPVAPGQAMIQVNGGMPPYTYQWNTMPVQTTQIASGLITGQPYMILVQDAMGCSQMITFIMPPMRAGSPTNDLTVTAIPNPTTGPVTVKFENTGFENYLLQLTDVAGRIVYQANETQQSVQLDLSKYDDGIYSLKVSSNNKVEVIRLVLQKN